jgi:hypothetical protein
MAAMLLAMAMPAFGAPNPNSATGECDPPGETISEVAKVPGESTPDARDEVPGQAVKGECAPRTREDEEPI